MKTSSWLSALFASLLGGAPILGVGCGDSPTGGGERIGTLDTNANEASAPSTSEPDAAPTPTDLGSVEAGTVACKAGDTLACETTLDAGKCTGKRTCDAHRSGEFNQNKWGPCVCDVYEIPLDINGDCVTVSCPSVAPYPVGCKLDFQGSTPRGCVAQTSNASTLFLKEGDDCGAGRVVGKLICSSVPGGPLGPAVCPINKAQTFYPSDPSGCPTG